MTRFEHASKPLARINCVPEYFPHPRHLHSISDHGKNPDCLFFAVLNGDFSGIYNDLSQVKAIIHKAPDTKYASDGDWIGITRKWREHCEGNHEHDWPRATSRSSSPLSSASAFDTSPCPSPDSSRTPSPDSPPFSKSIPFFDPPSTSRRSMQTPSPRKKPLSSSSSRTPVAKIAKHTPSSPTKGPSTAHAAIASSSTPTISPAPSTRTKAAGGLKFPRPVYDTEPVLLPFPARLLPEMGRYPPDPPRLRNAPPHYEETLEGRIDQAAPTPVMRDICVFYAVSIANRMLKSHRQAFDLFRGTEGAEILLVGSVGEAAAFFEAAEHAGGATGSTAAPLTMYAVSSHRGAFKNRETAFRRFLREDCTEMLFASSSVAIEGFIREHMSM
ncbi:hypothetical protein DFH09DRAFT_1303297 [Mycena vulgaris]|nr:hypothetical protein DFH09DRAFT_1303297 [Mycena vulgaris]